MTELPVANKPRRRPRWVSIGVIALVAIVLVLIGYSCLRPSDRSSYSAPAAQLAAAPEGVTYVANGMLYVVAQPDGSLLALDEIDRVPGSHQSGCVVRWRPDLQGGLFMQDQRCGGATFDRTGTPPAGGLPLLRHPLRLAGKRVVVDIRHCMAPENGTTRLCKDLFR